MPFFSTVFNGPPTLPLTVEVDIDSSAVRLSWPQTALAQSNFFGYHVYRSMDGGATWDELASIPLITTTSYSDFMVPLNQPVIYRLTQANSNVESAPAEGSATLETLQWWVVQPNNESMTFAIPKVTSVTLKRPRASDAFVAVGRSGKIIVGDVVQAEDGQLTFTMMPNRRPLLELLRRAQAREKGGFLLKAPDTTMWYVQFGDVSRSFTSWGGQEVTLPFTGIG